MQPTSVTQKMVAFSTTERLVLNVFVMVIVFLAIVFAVLRVKTWVLKMKLKRLSEMQ